MAIIFSAIIGGMLLTLLVAWLVFFDAGRARVAPVRSSRRERKRFIQPQAAIGGILPQAAIGQALPGRFFSTRAASFCKRRESPLM